MLQFLNPLKKLIFFFFTFCITYVHGQDVHPKSVDELVALSQKYYGADDRLLNGTTVSPINNLNAEGHPFFLRKEWIEGDIFINGEKFSRAALKYNIETEEIIFTNRDNAIFPPIILNTLFIDSIRLEDHLFINSGKLGISKSMGFVEKIYQGYYFSSFLKHRVTHVIKQAKSQKYIEYYNQRPLLYVLKNNELISLKSKKDLLKEFSSSRKEIIKFMHQNKIRFKKASKDQLFHLLNYCDEI